MGRSGRAQQLSPQTFTYKSQARAWLFFYSLKAIDGPASPRDPNALFERGAPEVGPVTAHLIQESRGPTCQVSVSMPIGLSERIGTAVLKSVVLQVISKGL